MERLDGLSLTPARLCCSSEFGVKILSPGYSRGGVGWRIMTVSMAVCDDKRR
jgi:hypothetical protein